MLIDIADVVWLTAKLPEDDDELNQDDDEQGGEPDDIPDAARNGLDNGNNGNNGNNGPSVNKPWAHYDVFHLLMLEIFHGEISELTTVWSKMIVFFDSKNKERKILDMKIYFSHQ